MWKEFTHRFNARVVAGSTMSVEPNYFYQEVLATIEVNIANLAEGFTDGEFSKDSVEGGITTILGQLFSLRVIL